MNKRKKILSLLLTLSLTTALPVTALAKDSCEKKEGLTDIGVTSLYSKIEGSYNGVSVVFESGYGDGIYTCFEDGNYETWGPIQSEISKLTETIAYDRAGIGKSLDIENRIDLSGEDRENLLNGVNIPYDGKIYKNGLGKTSMDKAIQLHSLLKANKVKAPYLLVMHSFAGLEAVEFAKLYKNEVAGILMVDPSGTNAIGDTVDFLNKYIPEMKDMYLGQFTKADGTLDENLMSEHQVWNAGDVLRNIPMTFLVPADNGMGDEYNEMRKSHIEHWLSLSDKSKQIVIDNVSHYIQVDNPQIVIDNIKAMLDDLNNEK